MNKPALVDFVDVVIVGAGPYGLSIAAHLKSLGVDFRIFGRPMDTWLRHMPKGMRLKSEGFASCLYDPGSTFALEDYCREKAIPYADLGLPVPLEVFSSYGLEFQRRFVSELEDKVVVLLERITGGFRVQLEDGEVVKTRRVVLAIGLTHYDYVPPVLSGLPPEFITHSSKHNEIGRFKGKDVVVVGAGASALDLAALLHQAGARVEVIARGPVIRFHDPPKNLEPSRWDRLRNPVTGIGPGWKLYLCANAPLLFRLMPQEFRFEKVRRVLGPAPCWFTKEEILGKVPLNVNITVSEASVEGDRVTLKLRDGAGTERILNAHHVIAATGYRVDLHRLAFMDPSLQSSIRSAEYTPVLSSNFESSVPGLYFVGTSAANTFGPLLRFAFGAKFTAKRISRHLAQTKAQNSVSNKVGVEWEKRERDEVGVS